MAKKETATTNVSADATEPKKAPIMEYVLTIKDGEQTTIIEGSTSLRQYQANIAKGFQNSGFQVKVSNGNYSGNLMIIDGARQIRL